VKGGWLAARADRTVLAVRPGAPVCSSVGIWDRTAYRVIFEARR
jgi:hypothetical protein